MPSLATSLAARVRGREPEPEQERAAWPSVTVDDWLEQMQFAGNNYPFVMNQTAPQQDREYGSDLEGFANQIYKSCGPVFSCVAVRAAIFSEAKFKFRALRDGRPNELFGTPALDVLNAPEGAGTAGRLLSRQITDVDLAGNWYGHRIPGGIERLRPDWMEILLGRPKAGSAVDRVIGYAYEPHGRGSGEDPIIFLPEEIAHWAPITDTSATYRGMSWLQPLLTEIEADQMATEHKARFFRSGATPSLAVTLPEKVQQQSLERFKEAFDARHRGVLNAYETLFVGGGADVKVVGADMRQLDFKLTQGAGETRIAAAARVPAIVAGFSEGLGAATYSNYAQARRHFADGTMRPLWREVCDTLWRLVDVPSGAQLWFDDRDIAFLQEDRKDAAEILEIQARTARTLGDGGWDPDAVIDAVVSEDLSRLKGKHSGLLPVQLQPPGSGQPEGAMPAIGAGDAPNGNGAQAPAAG